MSVHLIKISWNQNVLSTSISDCIVAWVYLFEKIDSRRNCKLNESLLVSTIRLFYATIIVDLTFRILTCRFLPAVLSHTWDLVCVNLSFASRDFVCPRMTSITHCIIRFCPSAWTPRFKRVELCIASARTTLTVSAVTPS